MITRQDIIDMANEAYLDDCVWVDDSDSKPIDDLMRFSKLVIDREREACAKTVEYLGVMRKIWSPKEMAEAIRTKA